MDLGNRRRCTDTAALIAIICLGVLTACVREKPAPPPPAAETRERPGARDLTGKPRDVQRGITPGALEAEGPPPPPPKKPSEKPPRRP